MSKRVSIEQGEFYLPQRVQDTDSGHFGQHNAAVLKHEPWRLGEFLMLASLRRDDLGLLGRNSRQGIANLDATLGRMVNIFGDFVYWQDAEVRLDERKAVRLWDASTMVLSREEVEGVSDRLFFERRLTERVLTGVIEDQYTGTGFNTRGVVNTLHALGMASREPTGSDFLVSAHTFDRLVGGGFPKILRLPSLGDSSGSPAWEAIQVTNSMMDPEWDDMHTKSEDILQSSHLLNQRIGWEPKFEAQEGSQLLVAARIEAAAEYLRSQRSYPHLLFELLKGIPEQERVLIGQAMGTELRDDQWWAIANYPVSAQLMEAARSDIRNSERVRQLLEYDERLMGDSRDLYNLYLDQPVDFGLDVSQLPYPQNILYRGLPMRSRTYEEVGADLVLAVIEDVKNRFGASYKGEGKEVVGTWFVIEGASGYAMFEAEGRWDYVRINELLQERLNRDREELIEVMSELTESQIYKSGFATARNLPKEDSIYCLVENVVPTNEVALALERWLPEDVKRNSILALQRSLEQQQKMRDFYQDTQWDRYDFKGHGLSKLIRNVEIKENDEQGGWDVIIRLKPQKPYFETNRDLVCHVGYGDFGPKFEDFDPPLPHNIKWWMEYAVVNPLIRESCCNADNIGVQQEKNPAEPMGPPTHAVRPHVKRTPKRVATTGYVSFGQPSGDANRAYQAWLRRKMKLPADAEVETVWKMSERLERDLVHKRKRFPEGTKFTWCVGTDIRRSGPVRRPRPKGMLGEQTVG